MQKTIFPLYTLLNKNIPEKEDLTVVQKTDFMEKVKTLDKNNMESFYALIKCHEIERKEKIANSLVESEVPYKGVFNKNDKYVEFYLLNFPIPLRHILYKFLLKYTAVGEAQTQANLALQVKKVIEESVEEK